MVIDTSFTEPALAAPKSTSTPSILDNGTQSPLDKGTLNLAAPKTTVAPVAAPVAPAPTATSSNRSVTLPNGAVVQINANGDIVSGDATNGGLGVNAYEAKQNNAANKNAANTLGGTGSGSSSYVSSSDSVQTKEDAVSKALSALTSDNPAAVQAHNDYIAQQAVELAALEARRESEAARINADFAGQNADLKKTQANETGVENILTQRSGGYLGMGASQTGALISLSQEHTAQMNALEAKRQSAIQTAQNAIDDKEFALAQAKVQEAKDYATAQQEAKQKYFEDIIQTQKAQQDNITFSQDQAEKSLKTMAALSPDKLKTIDQSKLDAIDKVYGVPGFAKSYIATQSAINGAKSQSDAIDAQQKMLNLLETMPKGQKITFPDPSNPSGPGTTYTGMGKSGDISTFTETDDAGRITLITYDKGSNTVTRQSLGTGGKTKSTGAGDKVEALTPFGKSIDALRVPIDPSNPALGSYITANQYVAARKAFVDANPGQGSSFDSQFPVDQTVIPSQGTLVVKMIAENSKAKTQ